MNIVRNAEEAVSFIRSGMNIFVHGCAATPVPLLNALAARTDLRDVRVFHLHTEGSAAFLSREVEGRITSYSFFTGPDAREAIQDGRADFIPVFLSDVPDLITSGRVRIDAALVQRQSETLDDQWMVIGNEDPDAAGCFHAPRNSTIAGGHDYRNLGRYSARPCNCLRHFQVPQCYFPGWQRVT